MSTSKLLRNAVVLFLCLFFAQQDAHAGQWGYGGECDRADERGRAGGPGRAGLMDSIPGSCPMNDEIEKIINEAIALGAPIYNEGLHMACYRVYEWASYKILYEYGKKCGEIEKTLKTALDKSHGDYSDTEKAWIMRMAFDKILGVPTRTTEPEQPKSSDLRKG